MFINFFALATASPSLRFSSDYDMLIRIKPHMFLLFFSPHHRSFTSNSSTADETPQLFLHMSCVMRQPLISFCVRDLVGSEGI